MRQAEQGHHPIGFDFQESLHQTSRLQTFEANVTHDKTHKTVGMYLEICPDLRRLGSFTTNNGIAFKQPTHVRNGFDRRLTRFFKDDMRCHHEQALQAQQPSLWQIG